ncbi:MAG: LytTR family DNA-binding domain-containing protein [Sphingomonadaceae bacterium]
MSEQVTDPKPHWLRGLLVDLSIMTAIGIVLALIGPFGSFEVPFAWRLVSWLSLAWVGYFIYSPLGAIITRLGERLDLPQWGLWIFVCLLATIPMTGVVWSVGFMPNPVPVPSLEQAMTLYFYVLVIGSGITLLFNLIQRPAAASTGTVSNAPRASAPAERPRFLDRLPPALGARLLALEMEDHYVRAHTALGSELVLLRMRDAVAELDGIEGMQVHRSWWVARDAVEDVKRDGRNLRLVLAGGLEAPVARARMQDLKASGWF